ncbi:MAG: hypothetical protein ACOYI5_09500 [Christensenellales bacterium]|jgi:hypothetical protein
MITNRLIFPIWMMFIVPISWAAIIPGTFLIALFALLIALSAAHSQGADGAPMPAAGRLRAAWADARRSIWRAWISVCAAYLAGTAAMLLPSLFAIGRDEGSYIVQMSTALLENPYASAHALVWTCMSVILSAAIARNLALSWILNKTSRPKDKRAALWFAILTAPYLFLSTYKLFY